MKSNVGKYAFALIVIGLIGFAIYTLYIKEDSNINEEIQYEEKEEEEVILTDLRLPVVNFDSMNPLVSKNKNIQDISRLVYEPLVNISHDYKLQMCLAKEISKIGDMSYVIKLKENIKWQNGTMLTAKDVQYTIDRLKDTNVNSIYSANVKEVIGVDVIDNSTVRINLNKVVPFFEYNLTFPIMSYNYYQSEDFVNTSKNANPVGTGRFKVVSNDDSLVTLKQNQNWWNQQDETTKIETIKINKYSSMGEVYNAFKIGNIDLIHTDSVQIEENVGTLGYNTKEYKARQLDFIAVNTKNDVLADVEVRQAINYAIDKANIVSAVYNNKYYTSNFPLDFGSYMYEAGTIKAEFNKDKSKQVLVQNGWEYKSKEWRKTKNYKTQRIKLDLVVNKDNEKRVQVAEIIKEQLESVGIKINIIKATDGQYQNYLNNKNYDLILTGVYSAYSPDLTTYFGQDNLANFYTIETQDIMNEINNISDEKNLKEKYNKLYQIFTEQVPYIMLYYNRNTVIYNNSLRGEVNANSYNIFYNIGTWYRQ